MSLNYKGTTSSENYQGNKILWEISILTVHVQFYRHFQVLIKEISSEMGDTDISSSISYSHFHRKLFIIINIGVGSLYIKKLVSPQRSSRQLLVYYSRLLLYIDLHLLYSSLDEVVQWHVSIQVLSSSINRACSSGLFLRRYVIGWWLYIYNPTNCVQHITMVFF